MPQPDWKKSNVIVPAAVQPALPMDRFVLREAPDEGADTRV